MTFIYSVLYIIDMTRTQLYLPESQYEELKRLASDNSQTFASLIRDLIDEKLEKHKKGKLVKKNKCRRHPLLKSLPSIEKLKEEGIISDGSVRHDFYIYSQ